MTADQIVARVIDVLEQLGVQYMLVGSYSSNAYGIPRSTQDADFVIELGTLNPSMIADRLRPDLQWDPQLQFETITGTSRYLANDPNSEFSVELFLLADDPFAQKRFSRRVRSNLFGREVWIPSPEDVIVQKLRWFIRAKRSKDRMDVRDVLAVQRGKLDLEYIRNWCDMHGSRAMLEELLTELQSL